MPLYCTIENLEREKKVMLKDKYLQPEAMDIVWNSETVLKYVREFLPDAKEVKFVDETGGEARTYYIDDNMILKTQRPNRLRLSTSLEREVFFLKQLEMQSDVSVPKVIGYKKINNLEEFTLMTKMSGDAFVRSNISEEEKPKILFELGKTLRKIHSINQEAILQSGLFHNDTNIEGICERFLFRFNRSLANIKKISNEDVNNARKQAEEAVNCLKDLRDIELVALHSNPSKEHTFVLNNKFSGLIDFGDAYISHPVNDLRRWSLKDRKHILDGYLSEKTKDDSFMKIYEISFTLDLLFEELNSK